MSRLWGDPRVLDVLKRAGESSAKVVQYLAWTEFEEAVRDEETAAIRLDALRKKLMFELARWQGRSPFRVEPEQRIRILLVADTQFGDPSTDPASTFSEHFIAKTLKQEELKEGTLLPDLIAIAGDLTHSGRPDQFEMAEERIARDLMGPLWGMNNVDRFRDRIVLVPGNHDVNLRFSACDGNYFDPRSRRFEPDSNPPWKRKEGPGPSIHHDYALEPFRRFAFRLTTDRQWLDSSCMSWVDRRFVDLGIRFFILNSVPNLSAGEPDRACFDEESIRTINRSLADDNPDSLFSIAISHHGLRAPGLDSDKQIDNWTSVGQDLFALHQIPLWIFGHYHKFDARSFNSAPFDKKPLWFVQLPTPRISYSNRGFCVLELERAAGKVSNAYVHAYWLEDSSVRKKSIRVFDKG